MKIEKSTVLIIIGIMAFITSGFFIPHHTTRTEVFGLAILTSSVFLIGYGLGLSNKEAT